MATKLALETKIQQLSTRLEQAEGGSASDKMRIAQVILIASNTPF